MMADELAGIANISWVEEDALRQDVAARVAAQSSTAALQEEETIKKAWRSFEESERALAALRAALEEAERVRAGQANGLQVVPASSKESVAPAQQISHLNFRIKAAERDMQKQLAALQRTQTAVEAQRQERLAKAREAAAAVARAEDAAAQNARQRDVKLPPGRTGPPRPNSASASGAAARTTPTAADLTGKRIPRPVRRSAGGGGGGGGVGQASPSGAPAMPPAERTGAVALPRRIPDSFPLDASRAVTLTEYSGGRILPSLNRVKVTRRDLKTRHLRYDDDTDMDKFIARQERRRRLEMIEALQRHRLEHPERCATVPSGAKSEPAEKAEEEEGASAAVKQEGVLGGPPTPSQQRGTRRARATAARVKRERTGGHAQDSSARRGGAGDDGDDDDDADMMQFSSPTLAKTQFELDETSLPGFEDENVIDVDAMMEEEEDMSLALLRGMLKTEVREKEKAEATPPPDVTEENGIKDEEGHAKSSKGRRQTGKKRARSGADSGDADEAETEEASGSTEELTRAYLALQLPPEPEVSLLPGIPIAAAVYDRLLDYQQEGLLWLAHLHAQRCGGILGDEMGLGKTIQVAALLNALHRGHQLRGPALVVTPMTVLRQWVAELHRWAPHLRVCVMHESSHSSAGSGTGGHNTPATSRAALMESVRGSPAVVVTTYTAMRLNCELLHQGGFQYVILDEGHKISNPEAGITLAAKSFTTPHRLILSGSPIQNRLKELWCLFDFVKPGLLGSMNRFVEEFEEPIGRSKNVRATPMMLASAVECAKALQSQIAPYLLRRLKKQVNTILPKKFERVIRVPLSDEQLDLYVELVASTSVQKLIGNTLYQPVIMGGRLDRDGRDNTGSLHVAGRRFNLMRGNPRHNAGVRLEAFRVMNQLRQICNHADLFKVVRGEDEDYDISASPFAEGGAGTRRGRGAAGSAPSGATVQGYRCFRSNNPVNVAGGSKLRVLLEMMREWRGHGHRALVFTQTRMMLDIIENLVEQENYRYIRMDGTTQGSHRQELMDRFNEDESIFLALLTTRVGGIGVNLIGADRVVIFDPDWNPITDVQARERAWRIGQTRDVCVYRLITSGTVEEAILRRQLSKTYVTDKVLKDPSVQRFFHQQENLVESFFLGAEYDSRVPARRKHVLAAQELIPLPLADSAGGEQEMALEVDDEAGGGHHDDSRPRSTAAVREESTTSSANVHQDGHSADTNAPAEKQPGHEASGPHGGRGGGPAVPKKEREFGQLLRVVTADEDDGGGHARTADASSPLSPSGRGTRGDGADGGCETGLLKSLLDGQQVTVTASDGAAQRLAQAVAKQKMARVAGGAAAGTPAQRSLAQQRMEFSLSLAAERRQAKETADREEQRRYAEEDAKKRTRERHGW